jgi:hypothetical protein
VTRHEKSLEVEFNHRYVFNFPYEFIRDSCPTNFDKRRGERVFGISSVGDVLRAEDAGIVCSRHGFKIAVVWEYGDETELDAEWAFDKATNVPPPPSPGFQVNSADRLIWGSERSSSMPTFDHKVRAKHFCPQKHASMLDIKTRICVCVLKNLKRASMLDINTRICACTMRRR